MRCDKCGRKFHENWVASESTPRYDITECVGLGEYAPINLCLYCVHKLQHWLDDCERIEGPGEEVKEKCSVMTSHFVP